MANSLWAGALAKGTAANKPTTPQLADDTFGFYYETDTGIVSVGTGNGGSWSEAFAVGVSGTAATGGTGTSVIDVPNPARKMTLTLENVSITLADANDYGSVALVTLPDTNMVIIGVETNLTIVKDGTGLIAATNLDIALGRSAASNATLASGMVDILAKQDIDTDALSVALQVHNLAATPSFIGVVDAANTVVYLNASAPTETSEDGGLTINGTIIIHYLDLGNVTS